MSRGCFADYCNPDVHINFLFVTALFFDSFPKIILGTFKYGIDEYNFGSLFFPPHIATSLNILKVTFYVDRW